MADTTSATANAYSSRAGGLIPWKGDSTLFVDPLSLSMLVIDGKADQTCALMGTIMMTACRQRGIAGVVVDAAVRDELAPLIAKPFANLNDYRDRTANGWEFSALTNVTRNWTLIAAYSNNKTLYTRFFPLLGQYLTEARATAKARGLDPVAADTRIAQRLRDRAGAQLLQAGRFVGREFSRADAGDIDATHAKPP